MSGLKDPQRTAVHAFGRRALVDAADPSVRAALRALFPPTVEVCEAPSDYSPERAWTAAAPDDVVRRVAPEIEIWFAEWAESRVFVHSGCVEWSGRAMLLPGRSMAGKTTMTAALLAAGARYMSDEFAVLDSSGRVHAYPRTLRVRRPGGWQPVAAGELGSSTTAGPVPVGLVARLSYDSTVPPALTHTTAARGVLELMDNTVCARSRPHDAMDAVSAAVADARVLVGTRGEATETAAALLAAMP